MRDDYDEQWADDLDGAWLAMCKYGLTVLTLAFVLAMLVEVQP
jgi:hypothetical protein